SKINLIPQQMEHGEGDGHMWIARALCPRSASGGFKQLYSCPDIPVILIAPDQAQAKASMANLGLTCPHGDRQISLPQFYYD
ncbi:MAG: hypothetical protein Q7S76_02320, partial [bacterium]|nr:hypothetical protein [bacterium]